ncbi:MAG TPA: methyltransferase domain-containing protein [Anaerolineales bacterium]|nr:methyltransferase domain-containing protein [Anaerolineales bacterium]HLO28076.1 methyltransferase domain-containing protein [Anaerolineales bacterium]
MRTNSAIFNPVAKYVDDEATALTRARYQRISPIYDKIEWLMERRSRPWREKLWQFVYGPRILEVGVGTGKNMEFWPQSFKTTAIDLTPGMLDRAHQRAKSLNRQDVDLRLGDVQHLEFPSASFDTVVATFVFCSVPDPIQGLREIGRVVRSDGQILLLEHVRIDRPVIGSLMDALAPLIVRINGANINRRTVENVRIAGLEIEHVEDLDKMGMFKLIFAHSRA